MGFEPLQRASHLASQFLRVHLFALDRRQPLEFVLCFAQSRLPPLLIPLLTPGAASNHVAFALAHDFHHLRAIPQLGRLFGGKLASNSSSLLAPNRVTYLSFSSSMASRLTLLLMPPSNTKTASRMPKRRRKVLNSPCVVVSPRLPRKTSKCSGRPCASVATASRTCGRSERWSRLCPY